MARQGAKLMALLMLAVIAMSTAAAAQQKVKLEIKSTKGELAQYTAQFGGVLDLDLMEMPFPHATTNIKNLEAMAELDLYFETLDVQEGNMTFDVKGVLDKVVLGGLLELDGLGFKSTMLSPQITMVLDGTGKIHDLDLAALALPDAGMPEMKGLSNLGFSPRDIGSFMPMLIGLLPSILPAEEIPIGGGWSTEVNFDDMGLGGALPRVPFEFTLIGVKDGIADIEFKSASTYDGKVLKSFLAIIPELPMGKDIVKIQDVGLLVKWAGTGTMKFNVDAGRIEDMVMNTDMDVDLSWNVDFTHPDDSKEEWAADGKIKAKIKVGLKYAGAPSVEDVKNLFPPEDAGDEVILD